MSHDADHRIRERAYHLWEAAGRPHGRDPEFWQEASRLEHEHAAVAEPASPEPAPVPAKPRRKAAEPAEEAAKPKRASRKK